jgi:hypothetical protein
MSEWRGTNHRIASTAFWPPNSDMPFVAGRSEAVSIRRGFFDVPWLRPGWIEISRPLLPSSDLKALRQFLILFLIGTSTPTYAEGESTLLILLLNLDPHSYKLRFEPSQGGAHSAFMVIRNRGRVARHRMPNYLAGSTGSALYPRQSSRYVRCG